MKGFIMRRRATALLRQMMALCRNMAPMTKQDEGNVDPAHPAHGDGIDVAKLELRTAAGLEMDRRARELLRDAFVALAAGGVEIGAIDGGARIARRQNVVHAVATGAVGGDDRTALGGQAVIAVEVAGDAVAGDAELLREAHALVAAGAGVARKVLLGDRRVGIGVRLDGVDAVAIGADRGEHVAARNGLPVNAGVEGVGYIGVALAAGGRDVELLKWATWDRWRAESRGRRGNRCRRRLFASRWRRRGRARWPGRRRRAARFRRSTP